MILIILGIICILFILMIRTKTSYYESTIPNRIWTFWDESPPPEFIQKCIDTWKTECPGFEVTVISKETLHDYVGPEEAREILDWKFNTSAQRLSDLIRLSVLSLHGGIWLDASIVAYSSFQWVIDDGAPCIMFSIKEISEEPTLESWFIACTKGNEFVSKWNEEFRRIAEYDTIDDYIEDVNVSLEGIGYPDYLLVYVSCRKIFRDYPNSVKILSASEGPYIYHVNGGINTLCGTKPRHFIKMRKEDRAAVKEAGEDVEACVFNKNVGHIQDGKA